MLKDEWIKQCLRASRQRADFYSGCRKILRSKTLVFTGLDDSLQLADAGYTKSKLTMLKKNYLHEESLQVAIDLWKRRLGQGKYGSVGFTCYAHFVKGGSIDAKRSKRASVFGPCIQSVVLTLLNKREAVVTVFYRTTELLKKFPADLVFIRDVLLEGFNFDGLDVTLECQFANITVHPMYGVTLIPSLPDWERELNRMKVADRYFFDWWIKWSARYVCEEHHRGIAKFSQALRVAKDVAERTDPDTLSKFRDYCRVNHPGYRNAYVPPMEEEDDD